MDGWLKQSVAATLLVGPLVDSTDGNTVEGALTISQADVRLSKNAGAYAQKADATACTHLENGMYSCPVSAGDTDTLGRLDLVVNETGALITRHSYMVLSPQVWDALFGADLLQVDATQWLGSTPNALVSGRVDSLTNAIGANVITETAIASNAITAPKIAGAAITAGKIADGALDRATFAADTGLQTIRSDTAQAGAVGSITLDAAADAVTDFFVGAWILLTGSTGAGQARVCTAYNGTTKVATVAPNWATTPDATTTFAVLPAAQLSGIQGTISTVGTVDALGTQAKADVNAEILDALNTDTYALPSQGALPATTTYGLMLRYLYKFWRNANTFEASTGIGKVLADDDVTVDHKMTKTTAAGITTRSKYTSGP